MEPSQRLPWILITLVCVLFSLFHRVVFTQEIGPTTFWRPVRSLELEPSPPTFPLPEEGTFFVNRNHVGYLEGNGGVAFYQPFEGFLSGGPDQLVASDPTRNQVLWIGRRGTRQFIASESLFVLGDMRFSVDETGLTLRAWDEGGTVIWSRTRASPFTCFSQATDLIGTGDASGLVELLDRQGRLVSTFRPGGSRYEVIYQIAVSPSGRRVAVLSGLEPKRLVILEKGLEDFKPIQHERVEDNRRFSTELRWLDEDHFLFSDRDGQRIQVRQVLSEWNIRLDIVGDVVDAELIHDTNELLLAVFHQGRLSWFVLTKQGRVKFRSSTPTELPWTERFGNRFYFLRERSLKSFERDYR